MDGATFCLNRSPDFGALLMMVKVSRTLAVSLLITTSFLFAQAPSGAKTDATRGGDWREWHGDGCASASPSPGQDA